MESGTPKKTKKLQIDSQHGIKDNNIDAQTEPRTKKFSELQTVKFEIYIVAQDRL